MGYTHYWYRKIEIDQGTFDRMLLDFVTIQPYLEDIMKGKLAGGSGEGLPELSTDAIIFNGNRNCGHKHLNLGITWPSDDASGISNDDGTGSIDGSWHAGAKIASRTCGGDCSHETFYFPRVNNPEYDFQLKQDDYVIDFTKTAYKPYDLAVNVALIIAKHHLGDRIYIHSDGEDKHWEDGRRICQAKFGYGADFKLDEYRPANRPETPEPKPVAEINTKTGVGYIVIAEVDSSHYGEAPHQIKAHSDGVLECDCKGWKFCKGDKKQKRCRHIREMELYITTDGKMGKGVRLIDNPLINNPLLSLMRDALRGGM